MSKMFRSVLLLGCIGAVFLSCQSSQERTNDDPTEIEAVDNGIRSEPSSPEESEAASRGPDEGPENTLEGSEALAVGPATTSLPGTESADTPLASGATTYSPSSRATSNQPAFPNSSVKRSPTATSKPAKLVKPTSKAPTKSSLKEQSKVTGTTVAGTMKKFSSTTKPLASSSTIPTPAPTTPNPNTDGVTIGYDASPPDKSWSKPAIGKTYSDPNYGTKLRRATSAAGTRFNRNDYSRRQAENADGSLFITYHGDARFDVNSVTSLELVKSTKIHPNGEPQWHPTNPDVIRHIAGGNASVGDLKLYETNLKTGRTAAVADLTSRVQAQLPNAVYIQDRAEGAPSRDGNRYAWLVFDRNEKQIGLLSYDLGQDRILGLTTDIGSAKVDWSSYAASGKYVVAGALDSTYVYDADLSNRRTLTTATEHSDLALDSSGNDAYVYIDFETGSPTVGWLVSVDLQTLKRTKIFEVYQNDASTSMHISGRGFEKPGWVIVSTYSCKDPGAWSCDKVMAVELAPNGRIVNLAHTYNCGQQYWAETHATVNRSFTRVYFNSDGGSCGADAEVYQLEVPNFS